MLAAVTGTVSDLLPGMAFALAKYRCQVFVKELGWPLHCEAGGVAPNPKNSLKSLRAIYENISALIAEHDAKIVGFTMFAPAMNEHGLYGRAFYGRRA